MNKKIKKIFFKKAVLFSAVSLLGCSAPSSNASSSVSSQAESSSSVEITKDGDKTTSQLFAMDTVMNITIYGENGEKAMKDVINEIEKLDNTFATTNENSDISKINSEKKSSVSDDTYTLVKRGLEFFQKTNGVLDISIYPVVREWGFTTGEYKIPDEQTLSRLKEHIDSNKVKTDDSTKTISLEDDQMLIDLGSIAKGYTSDKISKIMKNDGIESAVVSLGGNVQAVGKKPDGSQWKVAIQNPFDENDYAAVVTVDDCAVITSGAYQRYFEQDGKTYHHIMDPSTCAPADTDLASVTIVSKDATLADAYSTTLFILGKEKAVDFWCKNKNDFDIILISKDNSVVVSQNIADSFTVLNENFDNVEIAK